jgi:hypothetical protein
MRSEFSIEQRITRMILMEIDHTTKDLQRTNRHALSIDEIRTELGEFSDAWRQPLIYTNQGTNVVAISYGRDGKPGGSGLDSDLSSLDPSPKESLITLHQFYFELPTGKIVAACILCAAMASAISLLTVRRIDLTIPGLVRTALILLATGFAALVTALTISALHIPSGH